MKGLDTVTLLKAGIGLGSANQSPVCLSRSLSVRTHSAHQIGEALMSIYSWHGYDFCPLDRSVDHQNTSEFQLSSCHSCVTWDNSPDLSFNFWNLKHFLDQLNKMVRMRGKHSKPSVRCQHPMSGVLAVRIAVICLYLFQTSSGHVHHQSWKSPQSCDITVWALEALIWLLLFLWPVTLLSHRDLTPTQQ